MADEQDAVAQNPDTRHERHGFWDPELAPLRKPYFKTLGMVTVLTIITFWAVLPVYWGSLAHEGSYPKNIRAYLIDRDGSDIGNAVTMAVKQQIETDTHSKLGWEIRDPNDYPDDYRVFDAVYYQHAWVALLVNRDATTNLAAARAAGDMTYNGTMAITVYYNQARNRMAASEFILPITQQLLEQACSKFAQQSAEQYLNANVANTQALMALTRAPQTITQPAWYKLNNIREFDAPVATALLLVGNIYLIISTFIITMSSYEVRQPLEAYVSLPNLIAARILVPMILYIPLSLTYAMVSLPFKVPFGAHFSYAGGFFLYYLLCYVTMLALGLATEAMVTILTPKFMFFFLLPWIISNESTANTPLILAPWFYKYGVAWPVYNLSQATRTLIFDTHDTLGLNAGILVAWAVLSMFTIGVFTTIAQYFKRQNRVKDMRETGEVHPSANEKEKEMFREGAGDDQTSTRRESSRESSRTLPEVQDIHDVKKEAAGKDSSA